MRVADFIVQYLKNRNIKNFFFVTGRGSLFLNDALAREKNIQFKIKTKIIYMA